MTQIMVPRLIRSVLAIAGGALALFHGWLFIGQAAAGRLEDPWLIFRWVAAASLVGALVAVRRSGGSIVGRKGIAIWVLAALLHGPSTARLTDTEPFPLPEAAATSVLQLISSAAFALGLWMLAALLAARRTSPRAPYAYLPAFAIAGATSASRTLHFSPRPPPLRR
jgi:hypothetical protein